jgi:hypothetical protein
MLTIRDGPSVVRSLDVGCLAMHEQRSNQRFIRHALSCLCTAATALATLATADAQCEYGWFREESGPGTSHPVYALHQYDPDGPGPGTPRLVVGGNFHQAASVPAGHAATYGQEGWRPLGTQLIGSMTGVRAVTTFDPDGTGPLGEEIYVGGLFPPPWNTGVMRWDGSNWQQVGEPFNGIVSALTVFDLDGDGPQPPRLIAGGSFTSVGGTTTFGVAAWDGTSWHAVGLPTGGEVRAFVAYDPDGPGPLPLSLYAGGSTIGPRTPLLARYTGSTWVAPVALQGFGVYAMTVHDADGPGGAPPWLVIGGNITKVNGASANGLARWDGATWAPLAGAPSGDVLALASFDHDNDPQTPHQLAAGGTFLAIGDVFAWHVARWDGTTWHELGGGFTQPVRAFGFYDRDGDGPAPARLIAAGDFLSRRTPPFPMQYIAEWNGDAWEPLGDGFSHRVVWAGTFDADGAGPLRPYLIATGPMYRGTLALGGAGRWDGQRWHAMDAGGVWGEGVLFDPDGSGPLGPHIIVVDGPDSDEFNRLGAWDGAAWSAFGPALPNPARAITVHDFDGEGPQQPAVVVATSYRVGSGSRYVVYRLDGEGWIQVGADFTSSVDTLFSFDPDGAGPVPPRLIAGGWLGSVGGVIIQHVAAWNGDAWEQVGAGLSGGYLVRFASWDPDDDGPEPAQLIAGGTFSASGSTPLARVARWDGAAWQPMGALEDGGWDFEVFDTDGPHGPRPRQLIVCGYPPGTPPQQRGLSRWEGDHWEPFGGRFYGVPERLTTFDPDGDGPQHPELIVTGYFAGIDDVPAGHFARFGALNAPTITLQPVAHSAAPGQTAQFLTEAVGAPTLALRWRRNGIDLADGPTAHGSIISGSATTTLTISGVTRDDAGAYDCVVSNACGSAVTLPALLSVQCPADWDDDGHVTSTDISAFLTAWLASITDGTLDADFNADGQVTSTDVSAFLTAWLDAVQGGC